MASRANSFADHSRQHTKVPQPPLSVAGPPSPPLAHALSAKEIVPPVALPTSPASTSSVRGARYKQRTADKRSDSPTSKHISGRARSPATPSTAEEPATDAAGDDDADTDASKDVSEGERELVTMLRKVDKKSRRNQARYTSMKASVDSKTHQISRLGDTLDSLTNQMSKLEALCEGDLDAEALDRMFLEIPHDQRQQLGAF